MISSIIITNESFSINFIKIEINLNTGKMKTHLAYYEMDEEIEKQVMQKHRVYLPCKIELDEEGDKLPCNVNLYTPISWDSDAIENYTQALMDELYLNKKQLEGCKSIEEIEKSFMLEFVVL